MERGIIVIKRIIFDLDNTLIAWKDGYWNSLTKGLDKLNYIYDDDLIKKMISAIGNYENKYQIYNKNDMLTLINRYTKETLPSSFIDLWLEELSSCSEPASDEMIETLNYLSNKYDLVVLTNWFALPQINRLKNAGILHFFTEVYSADTNLMKPNKESYLKAAGEYKASECLMIGDSLKCDVIGAINVGMEAIHFNINNIESDYPNILELKELKDRL